MIFKNQNIDTNYLVYTLRNAIAKLNFAYDAKLYQTRLKVLKVRIPLNSGGTKFDKDKHISLAAKFEMLQNLKNGVVALAKKLENKVLVSE